MRVQDKEPIADIKTSSLNNHLVSVDISIESMKVLLVFIGTLALFGSASVENPKLRSTWNSGPAGRIVNGAEAQPGQFPYQVVLHSYFKNGYRELCGGSLLTANYVLTVAHCLVYMFVEDVATHGTVFLGVHNRQMEEPSQQRIEYGLFNVHPGWNLSVIQFDVGTIQLATPAVFNEYVQPIELPAMSDRRTFAGMRATLSGFGRTDDVPGSPASDVLMFTNNPVLTNANCRAQLEPFSIQPQHICLSGAGGRGACHWDSGGPLTVQEDDGQIIQIGITSFVLGGMCSTEIPTGFARISFFLDWIAEHSDVVLRE